MSTMTAIAETPVALPRALSPSAMDVYRQCPHRYYLAKIVKVPDPPGEAAVLGTFVHAVLERLHNLPAAQRTLDTARTAAADEWATFTADSDFESLDLLPSEHPAFKQKAWALILGYFHTEDPTTVNVVATETAVAATIDDVPVYGIVDRLDIGPDGLRVTDYKTGRPPSERFKQERLDQLLFYAAALTSLDQPPARAALLYVGAARTVEIDVVDRDLARVATRVRSTWDAITADAARGHFEPTPNRLCDWCAYKDRCPAWQ